MITDEEIKQIAENYFGTFNCCGTLRPIDAIDINKFARAIYKLGRQHQREIDAELCRNGIVIDGGRSNGKIFTYPRLANAIFENIGELK